MNKVFIIAELSANHNGSKQIALDSVMGAKRAGADAIKLQTYTADTITLDCRTEEFKISHGTLWDGKYLHDLYQDAHTPWEWHEELFELARSIGLVCFSTPYDKTAVDFLEKLGNPIYKIASFEITDIPLIDYAARMKKPMIISTGIAEREDIQLAVDTCRKVGNNDITLLKCTSAYPAPVEEANLVMIKDLEREFGVKVGLSDHTTEIVTPLMAVALGATVIEKHFILNRDFGGPDVAFSLDEQEFAEMVRLVRLGQRSVGEINYALTPKMKVGWAFRKSIYVSNDIVNGSEFTNANVRCVRPGNGLHPKHLSEVIGKKASTSLKKGKPLEWQDVV
jgi:pseudaminic acid synthase